VARDLAAEFQEELSVGNIKVLERKGEMKNEK
jgi:hypothetical protein